MIVVDICIKDLGAIDNIEKAPDRYRHGALRGMRKAGQIVKREIKRLIKEPPKTGKKYASLPYRSSKAGESPAYQSGDLYNSVGYKAYRYDYLSVHETAKHGKFLEYGTRYMEPRPHVSTAASSRHQTVLTAISMMINMEIMR